MQDQHPERAFGEDRHPAGLLPPISRRALRRGFAAERPATAIGARLGVVQKILLASALLPSLGPCGGFARAAEPAAPTSRAVSIRVSWGGGKPRVWSGSIGIEDISGADATSRISDWRPLSSEADVGATLLDAEHGIRIAEQRPHGGGGVEIIVPQWRRQRLAVRLVPDGDERRAVAVSIPLADAVAEGLQQSIDRDGNRLVIRAAPGDSLRATVCQASGRGPPTAIFRPGETARVTVEPLLPRRAAGTGGVELRLRLKAAPDADPLLARGATLVARDHADDPAGPARSEEYEPVSFDLPLPQREGAYDIDLEAVERGGLRWSRQLAARTLQVVVVSDAPPDPAWRDEPWRVVHELDPGSPRLNERLRRLPAAGLAAVPLPKMSLPQMPLPSMSLPQVPLPQVPFPKLPAVPVPTVGLPSVAAMVPRFSGLLSTGHSTIEAHPLGAMLRLPPSRSGEEPTWEGVVIAGVQPGLPHLVEIEHPLDTRQLLAVSVLEADASGTRVEARSGCGIAVDPALTPAGDAATRLGRHAFVFWPVSRNPLLLVANPSTVTAAMFGRVRVSAGPLRPPASGAEVPAAGRRVHAFLPTPEFGRFGAVERTGAGASRPFADWRTFLAGAVRAAEWTAAQAAAGTMIVAYREGGAIWPSRLTRNAPRWDAAAAAEVAIDPVPKDLLGLLCRIHARERLRLLPALSFDAPLPDIEHRLAGDAAAAKGLVVVGRDGRPRRTDGGRGWHYNPLDPRVQEAVAALVHELAGRLRGEAAVDGAAIVLPHDGWMHLPGIAAGLDDATFSRFLADIGGQEPAALGDRFARRAALVEGPLKEAWLEWRGKRIAAFHARLAGILAAADPRFTLHVVPTTLLVEGDLARRFRPSLAAASDADFWREIGLDPGLLSADPRIVFVAPDVHAAGDSLLDRTALADGGRAPEYVGGITRVSRRAAILLERPVPFDCSDVVPHGPFGTAAAPGPVAMHFLPPDAERCRGLVEALAVSDVETVFDMRLLLACLEPRQGATLRAFAALPLDRLDAPVRCPPPLVVRAGSVDAATRVCLANAGPVACRAMVALDGVNVEASDIVSGSRLPADPAGGLAVPLGPWEVRAVAIVGTARVTAARTAFEPAVHDAIAGRLADLRRRRAAVETPRPLDVLDNPGFDLGVAGDGGGDAARAGGSVNGWDLVDPARGRLAVVPGVDSPAGRGIAFSSENGLATLRSNPFPPPANGRISVAVWLRIAEGDPQPPVRLAVEGVLDDREYYRFAPVGGLGGGKPLSATWSQFVLQIDDLPSRGLDSLRVRVDLLGPGGVQLDGVRVFDLAFDESQRAQLSRRLDLLEARLAAGDVGACVVELDAYWPRFLAEHVSDAAVAAARQAAVRDAAPPVEPPGGSPVRSSSVLDRFRRWWQ